jgi:hypothetical protein
LSVQRRSERLAATTRRTKITKRTTTTASLCVLFIDSERLRSMSLVADKM